MPPIRRALLSVSDQTGLVEFARGLRGRDIKIVSTGGTAKTLSEAGVAVVDVADATGFPAILGGRVKTLHPKIHGGLLGVLDDDNHVVAMAGHDIAPIGLLAVNLYPFEASVARGDDFASAIENIDVGGPAMIRAGAKNHTYVTVIVDPADYEAVLRELETHGGSTSPKLRGRLAAKAFARTAAYDAAIASWFASQVKDSAPAWFAIGGRLIQPLRYGENPHQSAALYGTAETRPGVATAIQVQGKELSYNNIADADAAFACVAEFDRRACVIVKHANPCGVAVADTTSDAYVKALACDPVSAFGGIIAFNRAFDGEAAEEVAKLFTEVIIAPSASEDAKQILARKPSLRLLLTGAMPDPRAPGMEVKTIAGGFLVQTRDGAGLGLDALRIVSKRAPSAEELADLRFAWTVAKHVKSNAIVLAKDGATVGIGAGQMSRLDAVRIAVAKAGDAARGAGVASDAFFPFADGIIEAADAGASAVIQPGGSVRDDEVIAAADARGLAMVFTGQRHFRH